MSVSDFLPAAALASAVTLVAGALPLLPHGQAVVLARLPVNTIALRAAASADAALVSEPAPGFAVLFGDAGRIRRALGLVVVWHARPLCSAAP
jgi:hypothetical protein